MIQWVFTIRRATLSSALVLVLSLVAVRPVKSYELPVHFTFTMYLAELAGFTEAEAFEIARYDQAIDDNPATSPMPQISSFGVERRSAYHFINNTRGNALRADAFACVGAVGWLRRTGIYLHAQEDLFSHRTFGATAGHLTAGHSPDKPWYEPGAFVEMTNAKFQALSSLKAACRRRAPLTNVRFSDVTSVIEAWAQQEYAVGTVGDDHGPERWEALTRRLYGSRLSAYTVYSTKTYQEWEALQERNSWNEP